MPPPRLRTFRWEAAWSIMPTSVTTRCTPPRSRLGQMPRRANTKQSESGAYMTYRKTFLLSLLLSSLTAFATIFGTVSGLIHDPQHRPVQGAQVTLRAANSAWTKSMTSDDSGEFHFDAVPLGEYKVKVEIAGFASQEQDLVLSSGRDARVHFA